MVVIHRPFQFLPWTARLMRTSWPAREPSGQPQTLLTITLLALNYYKQLVPNFEARLPSSTCNNLQSENLVASDSTWDGLAMANSVEHLGGAIVSPHSQSGIHVLHMIRILRERGKLDLVKGIIIPEFAIGSRRSRTRESHQRTLTTYRSCS